MKFPQIDNVKTIFKKIIARILRAESRLVLWKYKPKIVAITGSVGKTSTKDAVYAVLSKVAHVRKSEKSYNSEIGLPLTILGIDNAWNNPGRWLKNICMGLWLFIWPHAYPEWLVLEVGVGKPGDMKKTASWLKTDAVIITAITATPAHIEFFKNREHLIAEKAGLIKTLKQEGLLILNADDEAVLPMKKNSKYRSVTYGFKDTADLVASSKNIFYEKSATGEEKPNGIIFRIDVHGNSFPICIEGVFGINHLYAALAALAFSFGQKINMLTAADALKQYEFPPGRMRLLDGSNDTLIIDDTYNSSPFACESALQTIAEVRSTRRKIAVLGDMLELGKHTQEAHKAIGKLAKEVTRYLVVVGTRAQFIKTGALEAGMDEKNIFVFDDSVHAGEFLKSFIQKGDLILIKGSQSMRMERAVEAILLNQDKKAELLVRQDDEWVKKK